MRIPNFKTIFIAIIIILVVGVIALIIYLNFRSKQVSQPPVETVQAEPEPSQPFEYPLEKIVDADNRLYFINQGAIGFYDLASQDDTQLDFPPGDSEFVVVEIVPLKGNPDNVVILLEKIADQSRQFAVYNLTENRVTTKFVDRMLAVSWLAEQSKLLAYAKSKTGEPFFLLSSLNAKDQQALATTSDTDVQPLTLINNRLIYLSAGLLKELNLDTKEVKALEQNVVKALASPDGKAIAYSTATGLFVIDSSDFTKIISSYSFEPVFFNWSQDSIVVGEQALSDAVDIHLENIKDQSTKLVAVKLTQTIKSVETAFEDTVNNQLIYWSDGFLYSHNLK